MFFLPKLETLQRTVKTESSFRGLDARAAASERSLADCVNLSAAAFPVLSVCNPLETVKTVSGADYDLLFPGNDEMLEIFGENPVRIRRHFFHADGSIAEAECLLEAGEVVSSAVSFHGDLIVLAKKPDRIRLCRFDADGAEIKTVNMSDFLEKSGNTATLYRYQPNRLDAAIEPTAWSFTTQEFHEKEPGKKKLTQIAFRAEPEQAATLQVEISIDGREWQSLCSETFSENGARELRLKTPPGENFRLRFSGTGKLSIAYIRRVYHILSDGKIHPFI